jgi:Helix-turn-helix domain
MSDLDFLTTDEYAEIRRCGRRTIQRERETGRGCRYFQLGARVLYRRSDIERYIEEHVRGNDISKEPNQRPKALVPGDRLPGEA